MVVIPTLEKCEEALGEKATAWMGRCYEISCAITVAGLTPGAKPEYGHYHGPIAPDGYFGSRIGFPPRHGWLRLPSGAILDPTFWVFLNCNPFIALANSGTKTYWYYDLGGERIMTMLGRDVPRTDDEIREQGGRWAEVLPIKWKEQTRSLVRQMFGRADDLWWGHVYHLANRGPTFLGDDAKDVYQAIVDAGKAAWIPIDYRAAVLGQPSPLLCSCGEDDADD